MKHKIKSFIMNKSGGHGTGIYLYGLILIYVCVLLSIVFGKILMITTFANRVKDTMKESCIAVMTSNWDEMYESIREGYGGSYNINGEELVDSDRIEDVMQQELKTINEGEVYIKYADDDEKDIAYRYYSINVVKLNTYFKEKEASNFYSVSLEVVFEAPFHLLSINIPFKTVLRDRAEWTAKY